MPVIISTGEPAGIGPDISLDIAAKGFPVVLAGDIDLLIERAKLLGRTLSILPYHANFTFEKNKIAVLHHPLKAKVIAGTLNVKNSVYVISHILKAADEVKKGNFSALVTAPSHKAIINHAGIPFSGHTELLADFFKIKQVVMMLSCPLLKVALVTNHLPLKKVSEAITFEKVTKVLSILKTSLEKQFLIQSPKIYVCGLNPHAGEEGILGDEEINIIKPALLSMKDKNILGPLPADTLFTPPFIKKADAFLAMYHDQGLAPLKALGFGQSINITLGLPIIRTSVDHGTALELAGTNYASSQSLYHALIAASPQKSVVKNTLLA